MWEALVLELAGTPWIFSPMYLKYLNAYFHCEVAWDLENSISCIGQRRTSPGIGINQGLILEPNTVTSTTFESKQL